VDGTGSAVARLLYTLPGRPAVSVPFDADGKFSYPVPTDALDTARIS